MSPFCCCPLSLSFTPLSLSSCARTQTWLRDPALCLGRLTIPQCIMLAFGTGELIAEERQSHPLSVYSSPCAN